MNNFYRYPYYRGSLPHTSHVGQNAKPLSKKSSLPPPAPIVSKPPQKPPVPPPKPMPPHKPPAPRPPKPKPKPPKKKFDFKSFKKNTCTSLNDVECFLNNFSNTWKYIRLIKLLK